MNQDLPPSSDVNNGGFICSINKTNGCTSSQLIQTSWKFTDKLDDYIRTYIYVSRQIINRERERELDNDVGECIGVVF